MSVSGLAYAFLCLAAVYILVSYVRSYFSEKQFRKFAIANGAESPIQAKTKLPWSLDGMWRVLNSERNGEDLFDDIMVARFRAINGNTSEIKGPFGVKLISTAEPKNIQAMLATKFNDFELGSRRQAQFGVLLGNSIFNVDGPAWSHSRALFRPQFVRDNINDLDATERAAKILIDVIPQGQNGWTTSVDLMPLFFRFTLDTATAFIFGNTVDSQLAAASRAHNVANEHIEFADAFTTGQLWLSTRIKMQTLYWLCDGFQYRAAVEKVRRFTNIIIRRTLEARDNANSKNDGAGKYSVVEELAKSTQDPLEMRDQLIGKNQE
jgi:cytochrome P450